MSGPQQYHFPEYSNDYHDCDVCRLPKVDAMLVTSYTAEQIRKSLKKHGKIVWRAGNFLICGECLSLVNRAPLSRWSKYFA